MTGTPKRATATHTSHIPKLGSASDREQVENSLMVWHILDTGSIWLKEFAHALGSIAPTVNWCPQFRTFGHWENWERVDQIVSPPIEMIRFPLQRGYARFPIAQLLSFERSVLRRINQKSRDPRSSGLICTAPFYAPVAEQWPGRVVYYLTDLTKEYRSEERRV